MHLILCFHLLVVIMGWSLGATQNIRRFKKVSCKTKQKKSSSHVLFQKLPSPPNSMKYFSKNVANHLTTVYLCDIV